ncbi:MAG: glycosyltransferase [Eubacterium sp.]|nr:glycosyltransferase [Eubacterium sp.]
MENQNKKKVLQIVTGNFGSGGLTQIVYVWGKRIESEGIIFDFLCRKRHDCDDFIQEIHAYGGRISRPKFAVNGLLAQLSMAKRLIMIQRKEHYDVVHIHSDSTYNMLTGLLAAKRAGIKKVILHSHSAGMETHNADGVSARYLVKIAAHKICRRLLPVTKNVELCACSRKAAAWMYRSGLQKRVKIIDNGIEPVSFMYSRFVREEVRDKYRLDGKFVIGHVGRFAYQKNHAFILQLAEALEETCPDAVIVLIGDGELYNEVQTRAFDAGLDNVRFVGRSDEVNNWLQAFDLFVLPSHFEGLPVSAIEAQMAGLPCLISDEVDPDCRILPDVEFLPIDRGTEVWTDAVRDAIAAWKDPAADPDLRAKSSAVAAGSKYNIAKTIRQLKELYR